MVRNCTPTFVFTVKSNDVDSRVTKGSQLVNHFGKARNFTTKAGLIQNLRQLHWYNSMDPDKMYPRSYKLDEPEDRDAFLDDYRVTSCISFVRYFVQKSEELLVVEKGVKEEKKPDRELLRCYYQPITKPQMLSDISINTQCERFLEEKIHQDIDLATLPCLSTSQWNQFLAAYYQFVHEDGNISPMDPDMIEKCKELLTRIRDVCPQYIVDGTKNAWIVKPGAKSRGRGIQCLDKLESIHSLMECADGCMVVQKYIEQPFLVYNTKFDIRQWFLVTDWNPLTIWFYKHCYLRFCSQEFTLDNMHSSIHLSNNAIQKHFMPAGFRCDKLPDDNMWTSDQFVDHLRRKGLDSEWFELTVPGMKQAIISTLLCTQEFIETRKSAFELYGADFMMTDDMQPWLLEVNSSPSMSQSTRATEKLVDMVLEDTVKVVLDRRDDKQANTGCFEMIYRQSYINDPLPTDPGLTIHGRRVAKPHQRHR
ncbi:hypothetical protein CAPTEDRAFT_177724 [Capitella teleta]|uniref:Tubulin--tyrosine ligase-like protein 9 n=1 Tax=Capitella teleta TaxID=283909 RepID=R7THQ4_CAPTE|nr:hypothetical protein CAPTEDRAFT_177724 [Capitella teleta]|eukprot:ELT93313.1 hypothetical protein CAPTEDRAFT_177724 [Capitella teleta]